MSKPPTANLTEKHCVPCEGGIPPLSPQEVMEFLQKVPGWKQTPGGLRIQREWKFKNFVEAMDFLVNVGKLAEEEGHHPDLHLTNYRQVAIDIWTHAIGGLSENDFILAAKINEMAPS